MNEFRLILPEIGLLALICLVLVVDLYSKQRDKQSCYVVAQTGLLSIFLILIADFSEASYLIFSSSYQIDPLSQILKMAMVLLSSLSLVYSRVFIQGRMLMRGEFYLLVLFALLGMLVMVSSASLINLYLGLELLSLSLYALIAMERKNSIGSEAAIKYFITGAVASGFLLYGMSLIYGLTGHLNINEIAQTLLNQSETSMMAQFALVFIIAGVAFKLGLAPFHMWVPDVYHGSPTGVTIFLASIPKIAAVGFTIRLVFFGLPTLADIWQPIWALVAVFSITLGNLIAIAQSNLKRMLAYSAIAHMGVLSLGFYVSTPEGLSAALFYVMVYALVTLATFSLLIYLGRVGFECENLNDFKGLGRKNPWYALMLTFTMLSLAGIPPFIGFWPKLEMLRVLVLEQHWSMAVFMVLLSVVALFYYLRVIKLIYFDDPEKEFVSIASRSIRFAITFNCVALLVIGFFPDLIFEYCKMVFAQL